MMVTNSSAGKPEHSFDADVPEGTSDALPAMPANGGAPSDAPPSNRASGSYGDDTFMPLWKGVDFLELSLQGELNPSVGEELERLKALAQSPDPMEQAGACYAVGEGFFKVFDHGAGLFAFVLEDGRFRIKVRGPRGKMLPLAFVQVRSSYLAEVGPTKAAEVARSIVEKLLFSQPNI
jgi:hypothetical protein